MFTLNVRADVKGTIDYLNRVQKGIGDKVLVESLNRTIGGPNSGANKQMIDGIANTYNIKKSDIREKLSIRKASRKGQVFSAELRGNPYGRSRRALNVIRFLKGSIAAAQRRKVRKVGRGEGTKRDLQFQIAKGAVKTIDGAFILNVPGNPVVRRIDGRLVGVQTIGVPQMFQARKVQDPVIRWIEANFPVIFDGRVKYYLSTVK